MLCRRAAAPGASSKRGGVDTATRISPAGQGQGQGHAPRAGQAAAAPRCRRKSPSGSEEPSEAALRHCQENPRGAKSHPGDVGHRSPPPWGSPCPSPPPAPPGGLCSGRASAQLRSSSLGRSSAGAGRVELLRPGRCSPRDSRGPSQRLFAQPESFQSFSPTRSPRPPRRGAGAAVHPAALPAPRPLPPPLSGFPSPLSGTGAELRMLSRPSCSLWCSRASEAGDVRGAHPSFGVSPRRAAALGLVTGSSGAGAREERAGKEAVLPGRGARQHIEGSCSFLPGLVRESTQIIKNIYTFLSWKRRVISGFVIWWGLINTKWLHQMTEREDPFLCTLELCIQGRGSEAASVPCPRLPGLPSGLASAPQDPSPLPGHGGTGPAPGGDF